MPGVQGVTIEWIPLGSKSEARQLHLLAVVRPNPRATDWNSAAAQGDLARSRPRSTGSSVGISLPARTTKVFSVLLHHRRQNLAACVEAEIKERVLDAPERGQEREGNLDSRRLREIDQLEVVGLLGMLGHGGSFVGVVTPSVPHGGRRSRRSIFLEDQLTLGHPRSKISSGVGGTTVAHDDARRHELTSAATRSPSTRRRAWIHVM